MHNKIPFTSAVIRKIVQRGGGGVKLMFQELKGGGGGGGEGINELGGDIMLTYGLPNFQGGRARLRQGGMPPSPP